MSAQKKVQEEPESVSKPIFRERLFEEDEDPATFKNQLIAISDSYGEEEHYKPFTGEEQKRFEERIVELELELDTLAGKKKDFNKIIDAQMKPMKVDKKKAVDNLKSGSVWTKEVLYSLVDINSGMIGVYDERGFLQRTKQMKRGRGLQKTIPLTASKNSNNE